MVTRKGDSVRYPLSQTTHWLTFLAQQMRLHNQTVFAIEWLQPSWLLKPRRRRSLYHLLILTLLASTVFAVTISVVFSDLISGLIGGLIVVLGGLALAIRHRGWQRVSPARDIIRLAEQREWSWRGAAVGLAIWLGLMLFFWLPGLVNGYNGYSIFIEWLPTLLPMALFLLLSFGLKLKMITDRSSLSPGEGLTRSLRSGLFGGGIWLVLGMIAGVISGVALVMVMTDEMAVGNVLTVVVILALVSAVSFGMFSGMAFGLDGFLLHMSLRFWLWCAGVLPFCLIAFLEDFRARYLLKRVGGTYQFLHRLLLDYFAERESF